MLKISIICPHFPPEIGASANRIHYIVKTLQKYNCNVEVITSLPNYPKGRIFQGYTGKIYKKEYINGILVRRFWQYASNSNNLVARTVSMLSVSVLILFSLPDLLIRKPQIIIVNSPHLTLGLIGIIIAKLCADKAILNVSDLWPRSLLELSSMNKNSIIYKSLEIIERIMYTLSNYIMGQSNEIIQYIHTLQPKKKKFVYRNLISPQDSIDSIFDNKNIRIIYFGLLGNAQGIVDICQNIDFKSLGVSFHIYGDGQEYLELKRIKDIDSKNIKIYKPVKVKDLVKLLTKFHAVLVPLRTIIYGAVPSKIYTSIACGVPILFIGEGEGRKLVDKYRVGWSCSALDYNSLIKNIQKLKDMGQREYKLLRQHVSHIGKTEFNAEVQERNFINFLNIDIT